MQSLRGRKYCKAIFPSSRINWPGNSAFLYHPPSNEQVYEKRQGQKQTKATGQEQTGYAGTRTMGSKGMGACWSPNARRQ
jgi:hypothetical protein